ncbi:bifunctional DNA-formamidopyrimidine glycosylase/DNA-(apurinic or apyrimidinic site) lyase [Nitriliruptoraceae bacterium ZYF776]|nr:bifunctional DNA-formamidopyrimidine glycosylase/DNA-(apurinic or apyrimidinic site) lyase [Profundirhabdus halotolerans]
MPSPPCRSCPKSPRARARQLGPAPRYRHRRARAARSRPERGRGSSDRHPGTVTAVPELPEVESVRRQLAPELVGRTVVDVWRDPHPQQRFSDVERVVGRRVTAVRRRGKFLLCDLELAGGADEAPEGPRSTHGTGVGDPPGIEDDLELAGGADEAPEGPRSTHGTGVGDPPGIEDDLELVLHLGMTGSFRFARASSAWPAAEVGTEHVRARFLLHDGRELRFRDPRRFGRVSVVPAGDYAGRVPTLHTLGPEPLSDAFDAARFAAALARSSAPVKAVLLGQRVVAGVGNIYADEALWRARIHPASRRVGRVRAAALHAAIREVLAAAIEREGTTFRDYQMVNGESGRNADFLEAYGQGDLPCARCGTPMRRTVVAQRGTTFCPRCQRV